MMEENEYEYYHGTDARFVRMSREQYRDYITRCDEAIAYMWPFYQQLLSEDPLLLNLENLLSNKDLAHNVREACFIHRRYLDGSEQYQYGDLYLTWDLKKAIKYAYGAFVGGEYARKAYRMYQGAQELHFNGWNPNEHVQQIFEEICQYAEAPHEPVFFKLTHLDLNCLETDMGLPIDFGMEKWWLFAQMVRYKKDVNLDLTKAAYLPLSCTKAQVVELIESIESL